MLNDEELLKKFKMNIAIKNFQNENTKEHTLKNKSIWRGYIMKKRIIATIITILTAISGVVVYANFDKIVSTFELGKGIESAVENGYIVNPNMDYENSDSQITDKNTGIKLDNINVATKVDDFLMDDLNISTHFSFEIDKTINDTIDLDDLHSIWLTDLIVTDENNKILYCMDKDMFTKFCSENNLNYNYLEYNENFYNCGVNSFITRHSKESGRISFTYNMYTDDVSFPKSKKLYFRFNNIELKKNDWFDNDNSVVNINGNWNMEFDVPEEMYNRQTIAYKVVSCPEKDFEITNATVSNTGFEIGIIISNMKRPERPQVIKDLSQELDDGKITIDEYNKLINTKQELKDALDEESKLWHPITIHDIKNAYGEQKIENVTYVENENGEKFESTMSPGRRQDGNFIDGDKFSFYETFGLTTYKATDRLKVRVLYKDNPVVIELEKVN